jgi:hypothetical protein
MARLTKVPDIGKAILVDRAGTTVAREPGIDASSLGR